jgi:hypothetical protein
MIRKAMGVLKHELAEMLPPTIFFFVVFHLVAFARALLDAQYGISVVSATAATIGALVVGKAILLADKLPVMHWFGDRRLIYNVLWRIAVYLVLVLLLQCLEELIPLLFRGAGIVAGSEQLFAEIAWRKFWATHVVLVVFLVFYCLATAVTEVFGRDRILRAFLGPGDGHAVSVTDWQRMDRPPP